jgi:hypothetical protein
MSLFDERAVFLATIARFAKAKGYSVGISYGSSDGPTLVLELPAGQVSWPMPESALFLFEGTADRYEGDIDEVDEVEKLVRIAKLKPKSPRKRRAAHDAEVAL